MKKEKKLNVWLLIMLGVGSMIGSGIFNAPKDLIAVANPQTTMLAWLIGGLGALTLALVFVYLSQKRPTLQGGIFDYAREGFGDYMGFNAAWGYWAMGWLGNVSYFLLFFKTLNDMLGEHALSPFVCFLIGSGINWCYFFIISAGVKEGAVTNAIVTVAKLLPIVLVVGLGIFTVQSDYFAFPDWKYTLAATGDATTPTEQISNAMAIVLWCFVGMEAGVVLSGRAKNPRSVREATVVAFLVVLSLYILISFVAMGTIAADELYFSVTPLASVLQHTSVGSLGAHIVQIGIMVSVVGAGLSWLLLSTETMFSAAKSGVMPRALAKENRNGTPINALLLSALFTQFFLLSVLSPTINRSYVVAITTATSLILIPYLLTSFFALKLTLTEGSRSNVFNLIVAALSTLYSAYVIFAVGIEYIFYAIVFYALGSFLFYKAQKEKNIPLTRRQKLAMAILIVVAVVIIALQLFTRL